MVSTQQDDGFDTALARLLLEAGVSFPTLRACLDEVRERRVKEPGVTLGTLVLERGLAPAEAVEQALVKVTADTSRLDPVADVATAETPGQLGPYRLVRELARGGMGAVHEAVHVGTGARYALKTLLPSLLGGAGADELLRFRREAEAMGKLTHPHVAGVHAADLEGPTPYLVQDLLTGGTLRDRIRSGPLPVAEAVDVVRKLASALAHCHEHGILHRDLKPLNVLFDERGEPRLVDFGLAHTVDASQVLTRTGTLMGTPGYMAPEQARGLGDVDARTDVYGLGAVFYALLTGRPPFAGGNLFATLSEVLETPPARPSALRPDLPAGVEAVCLRALAKEPGDRLEDMSAFGRALAGCADSPRSGSRGGRGLAAGVFAGGVVLGLAAFALTSGGSRPLQQPGKAPVVADRLPIASQPDESLAAAQSGEEARAWTLDFPEAEATLAAFDGDSIVGLSSGGALRRWPLEGRGRRTGSPIEAARARRIVTNAEPVLLTKGELGWLWAVSGNGMSGLGERSPANRLGAYGRGERSGNVAAFPCSDPVSGAANRIAVVALDDPGAEPRFLDWGRDPPAVQVAFGPDNAWLIACSGSTDGATLSPSRVRAWSLEGAEPALLVDVSLARDARSLAVSREGLIALGGRDLTIETFSLHGLGVPGGVVTFKRQKAQFVAPILRGYSKRAAHEQTIRALAFAPGGDVLYSVGSSARDETSCLRAWHAATGVRLGELKVAGEQVLNLTVSPDGALLALGTQGPAIEVVPRAALIPPPSASSAHSKALPFRDAKVTLAAFDAQRVIALSDQGRAVAWPVVGFARPEELLPPDQRRKFYGVDSRPTPPGLLTRTAQGWVSFLMDNDLRRVSEGGAEARLDLDCGARGVRHGTTLVVPNKRDRGFHVVDLERFETTATVVVSGPELVRGVAFLPDGRSLVSTVESNEKRRTPSRVSLWDLSGKKPVEVDALEPANDVLACAVSRDGVVAVGGRSRRLHRLGVEVGTLVDRGSFGPSTEQKSSIRALAFSSNGAILYSVSSLKSGLGSAELTAWAADNGARIGRKVFRRLHVHNLEVSPDARHLALGVFAPEIHVVATTDLVEPAFHALLERR